MRVVKIITIEELLDSERNFKTRVWENARLKHKRRKLFRLLGFVVYEKQKKIETLGIEIAVALDNYSWSRRDGEYVREETKDHGGWSSHPLSQNPKAQTWSISATGSSSFLFPSLSSLISTAWIGSFFLESEIKRSWKLDKQLKGVHFVQRLYFFLPFFFCQFDPSFDSYVLLMIIICY